MVDGTLRTNYFFIFESYVIFGVEGEPTIGVATEGLLLARKEGCDLVIGYGGGSAIDTGKAIAALLTNAGDFLDYLEVIGKGQSLKNPSVPFIAIPTTSGTGAVIPYYFSFFITSTHLQFFCLFFIELLLLILH